MSADIHSEDWCVQTTFADHLRRSRPFPCDTGARHGGVISLDSLLKLSRNGINIGRTS